MRQQKRELRERQQAGKQADKQADKQAGKRIWRNRHAVTYPSYKEALQKSQAVATSRLREQYPRSGSASVSEHEGKSTLMSAHVSPVLRVDDKHSVINTSRYPDIVVVGKLHATIKIYRNTSVIMSDIMAGSISSAIRSTAILT